MRATGGAICNAEVSVMVNLQDIAAQLRMPGDGNCERVRAFRSFFRVEAVFRIEARPPASARPHPITQRV